MEAACQAQAFDQTDVALATVALCKAVELRGLRNAVELCAVADTPLGIDGLYGAVLVWDVSVAQHVVQALAVVGAALWVVVEIGALYGAVLVWDVSVAQHVAQALAVVGAALWVVVEIGALYGVVLVRRVAVPHHVTPASEGVGVHVCHSLGASCWAVNPLLLAASSSLLFLSVFGDAAAVVVLPMPRALAVVV